MALSTPLPLVIVGGGMASARLVRALLASEHSDPIVWVGAEPRFGYNRVLLPDHVSGRCSDSDLGEIEANEQLRMIPATAVEHLDRANRELSLSDGQRLRYQSLVLATGGSAPRPQCPGNLLPGVSTLRSLADSNAIREQAEKARSAVIIGGGLLGLEAGKALLELGVQVQIVHRQPRLLNRQIDAEASELLEQLLRKQGFAIHCNAQLQSITGREHCEGVLLQDGSQLPADLVIFATGSRPETKLAEQAGLACQHGIMTDAHLTTSDANIYALGECAQVNGRHYALVEPVYAQADALAMTLAGCATRFDPPANNTRLKVAGIALFAAGEFQEQGTDPERPETEHQAITIRDSCRTLYRHLRFRNNRLTAAVLLGEIDGSRAIVNAMHTTIDSPQQRQRLAFGASSV